MTASQSLRVLGSWLLVLLSAVILNGCTAGLVAMQMVPAAMGTVASGAARDRSPFRIQRPLSEVHNEDELAALDRHIRQAACGDAASQFWLGEALSNGMNTAPDSIEIYKWFRLAQLGEHEAAAAQLSELEQRMTSAQIAEAMSRARAWQPAKQCPANT